MPIYIKSESALDKMRKAGHLLAYVHSEVEKIIKPGISTKDIDDLTYKLITDNNASPSFLNYMGYPASACVSVNDEVVHGIPNKSHLLREGDIVSIDIGVKLNGFHSDAARTHGVGKISRADKDLIQVTRQSFFEGARVARAGGYLFDISRAIGSYATKRGYGVVKDLVGHGVGKDLHEEPEVPNFWTFRRGNKLKDGMTLAIEPMITAGSAKVYWDSVDEWTVRTIDGSRSAHYENTIAITDKGPEILTLTESEKLIWT